MPSISYAITACNEHHELEMLLEHLDEWIRPEDEILIQLDTTATKKVKSLVDKYNVGTDYGYHRIIYGLNGDFASFKNNLKNHCSKDYIFFVDADEKLSKDLLITLPELLELNPDIEMYVVPRVNTVEGLTNEHIQKWGWRVDEHNRINWPDYQTRIIKNLSTIKWENKVHERLVGAKSISYLPHDNEDWALYHPKTIERQEKQNQFYNTIK